MYNMSYKPCKLQAVVEEFWLGSSDLMEVDVAGYKTHSSLANGLRATIKRMNIYSVKILTKEARVYLARKAV